MTLASGWMNASSIDQMTAIICETFIALRSSKSDVDFLLRCLKFCERYKGNKLEDLSRVRVLGSVEDS